MTPNTMLVRVSPGLLYQFEDRRMPDHRHMNALFGTLSSEQPSEWFTRD